MRNGGFKKFLLPKVRDGKNFLTLSSSTSSPTQNIYTKNKIKLYFLSIKENGGNENIKSMRRSFQGRSKKIVMKVNLSSLYDYVEKRKEEGDMRKRNKKKGEIGKGSKAFVVYLFT